MCHCGLKLIGNMHRPHPFYRTFDVSLHVAAEPYAYSYVATCTCTVARS